MERNGSGNGASVERFIPDDEDASGKREPEIFNGREDVSVVAINFGVEVGRPIDVEVIDFDGIGPVDGVDVVIIFRENGDGGLTLGFGEGEVIRPSAALFGEYFDFEPCGGVAVNIDVPFKAQDFTCNEFINVRFAEIDTSMFVLEVESFMSDGCGSDDFSGRSVLTFGIKSDDGINFFAGEGGIVSNGFNLRGGIAIGKNVIERDGAGVFDEVLPAEFINLAVDFEHKAAV